MPIYEFRCASGHMFEVMRPISAEPLTACITCGAPVERVFHPIAVHFKGSGFYNTDYGTKKRSREAKEYQESKKSEKDKSKDGAAKDGASSSGTSTADSGSSNSNSGSSNSNSGSSNSDSGSSKSDSGATKTPRRSS